MKKLNNKGFTLVELLAVLVILVTILTIAIPSITSSVERNKANMLEKKYKIIEAQAEIFADMYKNKFLNYSSFINDDDGCCINISDIKDNGLLTDEDLKDANGNQINGFVCYNSSAKTYNYSTSVPSGKSICTIN